MRPTKATITSLDFLQLNAQFTSAVLTRNGENGLRSSGMVLFRVGIGTVPSGRALVLELDVG